MVRAILPSLLLVGALAVPAAAQTTGLGSISYRAYGLYDTVSLSASDSFDAVYGETRIAGFGAGVEALDLWKGVFARFTVSRLNKDGGERVVVIEETGQTFPTGIPTEVSMTPLEFGLGWRHALGAADRYVGYGGASALRFGYRETSEFASDDENVEESFTGYAVFAGIEATVARSAFVGAEVQYRSVPDAIGLDEPGALSSVARFYGEHDLGGVAFRVLFGIRR